MMLGMSMDGYEVSIIDPEIYNDIISYISYANLARYGNVLKRSRRRK